MGRFLDTRFFYFIGFLLIASTCFLLSRSISAQSKDASEVALMAECMPTKQFVAPSEIVVNFTISSTGRGESAPTATSSIVGSSGKLSTDTRVLFAGWHPNKPGYAVAFLEGPRMLYWAPCSPSLLIGNKIKLIAKSLKGDKNSSVLFRSGLSSSGKLATFKKLTPGGLGGAIVITDSYFNTETAEAFFGKDSDAKYTVAITMNLSGSVVSAGKNTIYIGVRDE